MQNNRARADTASQQSVSLPAFVTVAVISLIASALVTTMVLVVVDRYDRPSLVVVDATMPTIVVQVDGAIATPGAYRLPGGARLDELIVQAGGMTGDADIASVNLAARVGDGEVVRIPARSTAVPVQPTGTPVTATPINLNTASATELETLPGIGPVLSERIVSYREQNGPFTSLDQLADVEGISTGLIEQVRPMITLND